MTTGDFARSVIEGPGGMNAFEEREFVIFHNSDRVAGAIWMLQCLANPRCKGSKEALDAILARRAEQEAEVGA